MEASLDEAKYLDRNIIKDECKATLASMDSKKSPEWDGLTIEFIKEFWQELCESIIMIAKRAF